MKLFYRQFGEGRPVVILHGLMGLSDNWVSIGKRIASEFDVSGSSSSKTFITGHHTHQHGDQTWKLS